ncbi:MAG: hypothetical protein ACR2NZ_13865 [Rubripirellula sp.]
MTKSIEACPHRKRLSLTVAESHVDSDEPALAACDLVRQILHLHESDLCNVSHEACSACVGSFSPTLEDPNPVVASVAFAAAESRLQKLESGSSKYCSLLKRQAFADANLPRVLPNEVDVEPRSESRGGESTPLSMETLVQRLPKPVARHGKAVRRWGVGVTTAPRRQPTLLESVEGLMHCGWTSPHLFVDGDVQKVESLGGFVATTRSRSIGAWGNFLLGLTELVETHADADAFLMVQDDAKWPVATCLREYVEACLWPTHGDCIVSLYTCADDSAAELGWRCLPRRWKYGAVAFVMPRSVARRMTCDPWLRRYGWTHGRGVAGVDAVIGKWAARGSIPIWHPTPSLLQHVGHVSSIWPTARAVGLRRASDWVADVRQD